MKNLTEKLNKQGILSKDEFTALLCAQGEDAAVLRNAAKEVAQSIFGKDIYIRGLIEFTNYCKNDCYYCGIRRSNKCANRYRMSAEDIMTCCKNGYEMGFRTFVLQGGEDGHFTDDLLCSIVSDIKSNYPDCAVTLSAGEKSRQSYQRLFDAGADRYLLRHETANHEHYAKLHPAELSLAERKQCLYDLKDIGYQVGCGFMVGSPFQTLSNIAEDLAFISEFKPHMVGIGPFIPHKDTPFGGYPSGSVEMTLNILAIVRLMLPNALIPATTALSTASGNGREMGILSGTNVIMPNLSLKEAREKYSLYNNKASAEPADSLADIQNRLAAIGYRTTVARGDYNFKKI